MPILIMLAALMVGAYILFRQEKSAAGGATSKTEPVTATTTEEPTDPEVEVLLDSSGGQSAGTDSSQVEGTNIAATEPYTFLKTTCDRMKEDPRKASFLGDAYSDEGMEELRAMTSMETLSAGSSSGLSAAQINAIQNTVVIKAETALAVAKLAGVDTARLQSIIDQGMATKANGCQVGFTDKQCQYLSSDPIIANAAKSYANTLIVNDLAQKIAEGKAPDWTLGTDPLLDNPKGIVPTPIGPGEEAIDYGRLGYGGLGAATMVFFSRYDAAEKVARMYCRTFSELMALGQRITLWNKLCLAGYSDRETTALTEDQVAALREECDTFTVVAKLQHFRETLDKGALFSWGDPWLGDAYAYQYQGGGANKVEADGRLMWYWGPGWMRKPESQKAGLARLLDYAFGIITSSGIPSGRSQPFLEDFVGNVPSIT